ncbi:uncharacterized protein ABDE67_005932 [Symphorus nematophorus]
MPKPVFKNKGVAVITVEDDRNNAFPPLCQILKALCHMCCSEYQGLMPPSVTTAIGTIQIMVGLFNIGLGPGRTSTNPGDLTSLGAAYWLGAVIIVTGILSILAGQYPSSCLVGFTVFMNIAGAIFAITGVVLYAIDLRDVSLLWICEGSSNNDGQSGDNCRDVALLAQTLLTSMDTTLIAMAVIQLFVSVRFAILGIKYLTSAMRKEEVFSEMSLTVVKDKVVTVVTVASDRMLPPLCQILKNLCYNPTCCTIYKGLLQSNVVSALSMVQILVGLFNIGLGPGRTSQHPDDFASLETAYWLGGVYILAGITSLFADRLPYVCLVGFAVVVNIISSIVAIVGVVMYAIDLGDISLSRMCDRSINSLYGITNPHDRCRYVAYILQRLVTAMDITMIVLAVLQLCVSVSFAALAIKALLNRKKDKQGDEDVEIYQPVLKEVLMTSPGA